MTQQKTFLVTGGAGFIGSHLIDRLLARGDSVVCLDNFDDYYDPAIKRDNISRHLESSNYTLVEGDIRDERRLAGTFAINRFDAVIHLAAKAGVRESIQDAQEYYGVNVIGTVNLLAECAKRGVKKFILASSSSVYGDSDLPYLAEDTSTDNPISPYAATKKAGEIACHAAHYNHNIDIACLRFFTVYGPRQKPGMAISKFLALIEAGEKVPVFGKGDSSRGYTYISDIIEGIVAALDKALGFEIINLGGADTTEIDELVSIIEQALGKKAVIDRLPRQVCDVQRSRADTSKARRMLGWSPKVGITEGIGLFAGYNERRQDWAK